MADRFVDRVASRPNRFKVTPEKGEPYYVTLERADEPVTLGTPLNAASLNSLGAEVDGKQDSLFRGTFLGDMDMATEYGTYWCNLSQCSNGPAETGYGWLEVRKSAENSTSKMQRFTFYNNGETHTRTYVNSQWYAWFKVNALSLPLSIANGGTGATTVAAARNALGLGNTSGAVPIANGGTGATTVAAARNALGLGNTSGAVPIANGGTGATSAANACSNLGAVKKSGDTMTGTLTNTSTITIQRDTYPTLYYNTAAGKNKAAVICAAGEADSNGGIILRGWNTDSSAYKDLILTYANSMAVPVSNGGTGATTTYKAIQKLFKSDNTGGITSYPTAPGIYRTTGTKVCTNSQSTLSGYGVLVIFQAVYAMHFYLDSNGTLIYGYSGDTFGQPSSWNRVTYT